MTEIDLLKRVRDDVPDPDPLALARARQQLFNPPPVRRRATRPRLVIAGALALTLAGGFLAADVLDRNDGTVANASTFLSDAAALSNANPDAPIPPGQYRKISVEKGQQIPLGPTPNLRATQHDRYDTWIPSSQVPPYVSKYEMFAKVDFATPEAREAARKKAPYLFTRPGVNVGLNPCKTAAPSGMMISYVGRGDPCDPSWTAPTLEFLAAQPRDPGTLLAALRQHSRFGPSDYEAFRNISAVLLSGIVPADLRAALYQAARLIPGIQLLDNVVTIDGRRGRAIGLENSGYRHDVLISPSNGQFLGNRTVITQTGPPDINGDPENAFTRDDTYAWSSVTTALTATPPPPVPRSTAK